MVESLELEQFRNQEHYQTKLAARTVFIGENGSGKTSVLEAVRILSVGKSFRSSRPEDLLRFGAPYCRVIAHDTKNHYEYFYGSQFADNPLIERQLQRNGKAVTLLDFLGQLPTVTFIPKDVDIITDEPGLRRQYVDGILWQAHKGFRRDYLEYNRVLRERARLLFFLKHNRADIAELMPWNQLLNEYAAKIRLKRSEFIEFAQKLIGTFQKNIPGKIAVAVDWEIGNESLEQLQTQEIRSGHNLFGPHRDELKITCNDQLARRFASRGQARSVIALLKAVEAKYLAKHSQSPPILLLDDLASELDAENCAWLFSLFGDDYQILATSVTKEPIFAGYQVEKLK
ncbi:MAG: DNA replication and repair protein RecF [Patescibacteria group bacterium]